MRICFVASELLGAHKNGGIGTATSHIAVFLAKCGYDVSVVYTGVAPIDPEHPWSERFRMSGIRVMHLRTELLNIYPKWLRSSSTVYEYLRDFTKDLIIYQDWEGPGFASMIARETGLAFDRAQLVVIAHGPTEWLLDANRTAARSQTTLAHIHMERTALELADALICPSIHMLEWLEQSGMQLPKHSQALPLYLWSDPEADAAHRRIAPLNRVDAVAYFGRLEERKGIELFLDAITSERLAFCPMKVFFVGKSASRTPEQIIQIIEERRPWLISSVHFETDLDTDQAQAFLVRENCVAVIPSLMDNAPCVVSECIRRAIPFISTTVGGIPELVSEDDRSRVLVPPKAHRLAEHIASILGKPFLPAQGRYSESTVGTQWVEWIEQFRSNSSTRARALTGTPDEQQDSIDHSACKGIVSISVILTHYERPWFLTHAVEALSVQIDTNFELIIVDDGSEREAARDTLNQLEQRSWPFSLKIIRQANGYLGSARNNGIRASTRSHVIFLDDDNLAFPTLISTLRRAAENSGADIITCQQSVFTDPTLDPDPELLDRGERWGFTAGPPELGISINCFGDATGIYRRSIFEQVGYFHELREVGVEDWHLHARAVLADLRVLSLPIPLYWYRRVSTGMLKTTDWFRNRKLIWDTYRAHLPKKLSRFADLAIRSEEMP